MTKKKGRLTCIVCSIEDTDRNMAKHRNDNLGDDYGFCKKCVNLHSEDEDIDKIVDILRMMNIPFVSSIWENAVDRGDGAVLSKYLQLIATQKRYKGFSDSEFEYIEDENDSVIEITDKIIAKWGVRETKEEYLELEYLYNSLVKIKEVATPHEEKRYVQNVKLGKAVDTALETGDVKVIPQLRKAYTDDLKDLGLDVKQSSEDDTRTLGVRIAEWERHDPIPESNEFNDVDMVQEYIEKWFLIPMKRVFGRASEEEMNKLYE